MRKKLELQNIIGIAIALGGAVALLILMQGGGEIAPERSASAGNARDLSASTPQAPKVDAQRASLSSEQATVPYRIVTHNKQKTAPGRVLLPTEGNEKVFLLESDGTLVRDWSVDAVRARLESDGGILTLHGTNWGKEAKESWNYLRNNIRKYDAQGEVTWEHRSENILHHDFQRLENGNIIVLERVYVPKELYSKIRDPKLQNDQIRSDAIVEITGSGEEVWRWEAHDHLDLNECGDKGCLAAEKATRRKRGVRDWTHTNTLTVIPENPWYQQGHKEFKPGNLVILPRNWWTVFIVDRDSGEVVWKYTGDYRGGLSGGHEAHIIEPGLPGAGNMLIFDNGRKVHEGESFILEINPVTKELVWVYDVGEEMYSPARGSMQRLPNGNTLISSDKQRRCFEVTPEKEIVWEVQSDFELNRCRKYY